MLGYKIKDSFPILSEIWGKKGLYNFTPASIGGYFWHRWNLNCFSFSDSSLFPPSFNRSSPFKHIKPLDGTKRGNLHCLKVFFHFSVSTRDLSSPIEFITQPFIASYITTKHSEMIPRHQRSEESLRGEIESKLPESIQPSEKALGAFQSCMPRLMFSCTFLLNKLHRSPFGRTIHKSTLISSSKD